MALTRFHPAVAQWFEDTFPGPSTCQQEAWEALRTAEPILIAAPTGSGKTLAAFLSAINDLVQEGDPFGLPDETRVLYISPLKALSNDIHKNLEAPLEGIHARLFEQGATQIAIRTQVRTGDTPPALRAQMIRRPPHILVTTPESVYILLTSESGRKMLATVETVIIDEIHVLVGSKRGAHLALSLERLAHLTRKRPIRIGLSATQKPIETVASFLTGGGPCRIIDQGHQRDLDLDIELPPAPLEAVLSAEAAADLYDRMSTLIQAHKTTLIFVNTRRLSERIARALSERIGEEQVTAHHGSLSRDQRLSAERRLKQGELKALVATASLELGIDIGDVDLVLQFGSTRSIATFLQRVGRSGHHAGGLPKGRLFPTSRDDLLECIALIRAVRKGQLDALEMPEAPLDILAQQIIALVATEAFEEHQLFELVRRAYPYRALTRAQFDAIIQMLAEGFSTRRGRRSAYLHRDSIHGIVKARKGARLTAVTCGGAIPDTAEYRVILEPSGELIGTVDEDFAIESMTGDIFQLGNASWRVLRLEGGNLRVEDAHHQPPSIPFWFGEAPGRTMALSEALSDFMEEMDACLDAPEGVDQARRGIEVMGLSRYVSEQAVHYLSAAKRTLGALPSLHTVLFERFFDESGGMQFIIHAPFGSRINRGWGLALRKRFCRSFNFELQAAATENAIILSLGTSQSFDLESVARYLTPETIEPVLTQALLDAPMFNIRWRWNAVCALALKRFQSGRKTPPYLLRMQAEDLVTAIFPDQLACLENIQGERQIPDHPLVQQTLQDCLHEAMDLDRLTAVISALGEGRIRLIAKDVVEPSPLAAEIVNARAYSFLDGAPLEERRTRAVSSRRWLDPHEAGDLGALDPLAIERVLDEAWPNMGDEEELHDALITLGFMTPEEIPPHLTAHLDRLLGSSRASEWYLGNQSKLILATERLPQFFAVYDDAIGNLNATARKTMDRLPETLIQRGLDGDEALADLVRGRLAVTGPTRSFQIAHLLDLKMARIEAILHQLMAEGYVLRGRYSPGMQEDEWCERRLLARIHRLTLQKLRAAVEPVSTGDFMRFLTRWHHLSDTHRLKGQQALAVILSQLEAYEAPASSWESDLIPARLEDYDPSWLDAMCLSGKTLWLRLSPSPSGKSPLKSSPLSFIPRSSLTLWSAVTHTSLRPPVGDGLSQKLIELLHHRGALFFDELVKHSGALVTQVETALQSLVARGQVVSDSFSGLRTLITTPHKGSRHRHTRYGLDQAGRWTLIHPDDQDPPSEQTLDEPSLEYLAGTLLRRYGIVFRSLLTRESTLPPWQDLLRIYRRMEARGDVRGGRFVAAQYGEQFALPEAVEMLRAQRHIEPSGDIITLHAADPLNLSGILFPGEKIPALSGHRLLLRDGLLIGYLRGKTCHFTVPISEDEAWELKNRLIRGPRYPSKSGVARTSLTQGS